MTILLNTSPFYILNKISHSLLFLDRRRLYENFHLSPQSPPSPQQQQIEEEEEENEVNYYNKSEYIGNLKLMLMWKWVSLAPWILL